MERCSWNFDNFAGAVEFWFLAVELGGGAGEFWCSTGELMEGLVNNGGYW